jgi:hypothetical protein
MAMALSCHPSMSLLQLLLVGLVTALPPQAAMNHERWQVDRVN